MKVGALITSVDSTFSNAYASADKVGAINDFEQKLFSVNVEVQDDESIDLVSEQSGYDTTAVFEDILKLAVSGSEYTKSTLVEHVANTYYKKADGKIYLDPIPDAAVTDGLVVTFRAKPTLKTDAGKATEDLELPDAWDNVYRYYLYAVMCAWNKEFGESNNWRVMFNNELSDYLQWMMANGAAENVIVNNKKWRW